LYQYTKFFPKKDRYSLGKKIDTLALSLIELVIFAGSTSKEKKLPYIQKAIVSVDLIKILLRVAKDIDALEGKKYIVLQQNLQEIGRQLGGWKKSIPPLL